MKKIVLFCYYLGSAGIIFIVVDYSYIRLLSVCKFS